MSNNNPWIVIDCESDGPAPVLYSLVSFAAVVVEPELTRSFRGETSPISENWIPEALAVSKVTREQHLTFPDPYTTMQAFDAWLEEVGGGGRIVMVSDNPAYDFQWMNYYLWRYVGRNLLGHSARRVGDLWAGFLKDARKGGSFRKLSPIKHDHDPLNDAKKVADALLVMSDRGLRLPVGRRAIIELRR